MKNILFLLLLIPILSCICSCSNSSKEAQVITLNTDNNHYYSNAKISIESIIKLEYNDSSIIGNICHLEYSGNRIYILDRYYAKSLFLFDLQGRYIAKTARGRGPGEMINPYDFYLDRYHQKVIVFDQRTFNLNRFDKDLNYLSNENLDLIPIRSFAFVGDDTVLVFSQSPDLTQANDINAATNYDYLLYTNMFSDVIEKFRIIPKSYIHRSLYSPICLDKRVLFLGTYDNNIYSYYDCKFKIEYTIDLGKKGITPQDLENNIDISNEIKLGNRIGLIDDLHETKDYISFSFFTKDDYQFFIYSKEMKIGLYSQILFQSGLLPRCIIKAIDNDSFIAVVEESNMREFLSLSNATDNNSFNKQDGNPYLIKFSLTIN